MILTEKVRVKVNNKNIDHLKSQNLDVDYGNIYYIEVKYLSKNSKYRINAKCESCGSINELSIQKYFKNKERGGTYNCKSCNNINYRKVMISKYGEDNPSKIKSCNEKRKYTCRKKYGSDYFINSEKGIDKIKKIFKEKYNGHPINDPSILEKIISKGIETKIERGLIIKDSELSDWEKYRKEVRKLTNRNRKLLMDIWDGFDYYDREYIKENFKLKHTDLNYPTLDHKISVIYGFKNGLSPEYISSIDNICITKRKINSSKSFLIEEEYNEKRNL